MKSSVKLLLATVCTAALATPAFADSFVNGSFENGTLSGWSLAIIESLGWVAARPPCTFCEYQDYTIKNVEISLSGSALDDSF